MAQIPFYTVDAFTQTPFKGNGAAVVLTDEDLSDVSKQLLASEFNLSETAFPRPLNNKNGGFQAASEFELRWFTPTNEVPLCGHATLATSHVIFNEIGNKNKEICFDTLSGRLIVQKANDGRLQMDFPQYEVFALKTTLGLFKEFKIMDNGEKAEIAEHLAKILVEDKAKIIGFAYAPVAYKLIVVLDPKTTRDQYMSIKGDGKKLLEFHPSGDFVKGIILTIAPEKSSGFDPELDFVLRYFCPWSGIEEDPATGSAQCGAAPFWGKILKKSHLKSYQCFPTRGADLESELDDSNGRIKIFGHSRTVFNGHFSSGLFK